VQAARIIARQREDWLRGGVWIGPSTAITIVSAAMQVVCSPIIGHGRPFSNGREITFGLRDQLRRHSVINVTIFHGRTLLGARVD